MEKELFKAAETGEDEFLYQIREPEVLSKQKFQGDTACHVALQQGHLWFALKIAPIHPPILYEPNAEGDTILHRALKIGEPNFFVECMKCLQNYLGENIQHTTGYLGKGSYLVKEAKKCRQAKKCRLALQNKEGKSLAYIAAENGYVEALRILMETLLTSGTEGPNGSTALHAAVRERKYDITQLLLQYKPNLVLCQDGTGNTPLHLTVMLNDLKMVELLVKGSHPRESVKVLNKDGFSPFHLAANMNSLEIFQLLLPLRPEAIKILMESRLLSRTDGPNGSTALHDVVREKNYDITQLLLQSKQNLDLCQDGNGHTPLHLAVTLNDLKMVELLVKGSQPESMNILSKDGISPIHLAATMNYLKIFRHFLQLCPNYNLVNTSHDQNALHLAVQEKATFIVDFIMKDKKLSEFMINHRDNSGNTPLHIAVMLNDIKMVELLLKESRPRESVMVLNKDGFSSFHLAANMNSLKIFQLLLPLCPEAIMILMESPLLRRTDGPNGSTALHVAVRERNYYITKLLLQYKQDLVLCQDGNGNTPLHLAVMLNDLKMAELLVKGSPPELMKILSKNGISPFHLAATMNYLEIFRSFLQLCPDCYLSTTHHGQNALHLAVKKKAAEIVEFIVKDTQLSEDMRNQPDNNGNTPLHIAASNGEKKMLNTLLASHAQVPAHKNKGGLTFIDISKALEKREKQREVLTTTESFHSSLLVTATLITTVTFTAAFTMPGGYNSDGPGQGMATLVGRATFKAFMVADAISMCSSVIATTSLIIFSLITNTQKKFWILIVAVSSIAISMIFMLVAFAVGVWVVIGPKCKWLAVLIAVATSCALLVLALVFGLLAVPSEKPSERQDEDVGALDIC